MSKTNRTPKGGIIIYQRFIPEFPPLYPGYDYEKQTFKIKIKSVFEDEFVVIGDYDYLYATGEKVNKNTRAT